MKHLPNTIQITTYKTKQLRHAITNVVTSSIDDTENILYLYHVKHVISELIDHDYEPKAF